MITGTKLKALCTVMFFVSPQEFLVKFLQEESALSSKELLVMHYLQRGRYVEGIRLNELLKKENAVCIFNAYFFSMTSIVTYCAFKEGSNVFLLFQRVSKMRKPK